MDFSTFSPDSKIWIYPAKTQIEQEQLTILEQKLADFLANWKAHGEPVSAAFRILENRFILITADANCTAATGCSIDFMRRSVSQALKSLGSDVSDLSSIFYAKDNNIFEVTRTEFKDLFTKALISENDKVYDLVPPNLGTYLNKGICLEIKNSWHMNLLR